MSGISIRDAVLADAEAIAVIDSQGIEDRLATLETQARASEDRRAWLTARERRHPVLVGEASGRVVGWGSLNPFDPRPAYDHVADFSVYVERGWCGPASAGGCSRRSSRAAGSSATTSSCPPRFRSTGRAWPSTGGSDSRKSACTASRVSWTGNGSTWS